MYFITYWFIVICICCACLNGPKLSQTTFLLTHGADTEVLTERTLKVSVESNLHMILWRYFFIMIFLCCAVLNFSHGHNFLWLVILRRQRCSFLENTKRKWFTSFTIRIYYIKLFHNDIYGMCAPKLLSERHLLWFTMWSRQRGYNY